jgi:Sortase domain
MPTAPRSARPIAVLLALAATIAVASAGVAVARQAEAPVVRTAPTGAGAVHGATTRTSASAVAPDVSSAAALRREHTLVVPVQVSSTAATWTSRATSDAPTAKAQVESKGGTGSASAAALSGRNKVWIPTLGIRRSVSFFSCSSKAYPGNRVYRWGCAGRNNVYLFGHAHSVFKPLHDAYVRGRLRKGMKAYFADSHGRVSTYKVIWWRVTTPDKGGFAYAAQSRPSMTLQTCVGARSQYRLIVRLVKVG